MHQNSSILAPGVPLRMNAAVVEALMAGCVCMVLGHSLHPPHPPPSASHSSPPIPLHPYPPTVTHPTSAFDITRIAVAMGFEIYSFVGRVQVWHTDGKMHTQ